MHELLIADDHAVVRKGIIHILRGEPDLVVQGEAATGGELLDLATTRRWDALVMDLNMPGLSGIELLKLIREQNPRMPVLVLSVHPEEQYAVRVIRAGASGYLTKASMPEELVRAIRKVCSGGKYVSEAVAEQLAHAMGPDLGQPPHQLLSDREFQVLRLMGTGLTPTQIAEKLQISIKTVTTYRARILDKLKMQNSAQLVRYALMEGLVE